MRQYLKPKPWSQKKKLLNNLKINITIQRRGNYCPLLITLIYSTIKLDPEQSLHTSPIMYSCGIDNIRYKTKYKGT